MSNPLSTDRRLWALRAVYLGNFALSHAAAWAHNPWLAIFFVGIAFWALSRTHNK